MLLTAATWLRKKQLVARVHDMVKGNFMLKKVVAGSSSWKINGVWLILDGHENESC